MSVTVALRALLSIKWEELKTTAHKRGSGACG